MDTQPQSPPPDVTPARLSVLALSDLPFLESERERAYRLIAEGRAHHTSSEGDAETWQSLEEDLNDATVLLRTFAFPTTAPADVNLVPQEPTLRAASFNYVAHSLRTHCFLVELAHARRSGRYSPEWLRRNAPPVLDGEAPWHRLLREAGTEAPRTGSSLEGRFLETWRSDALQQLGAFASRPCFAERCTRLGAAVVRIAAIAYLKRLLRHTEALAESEREDAQQLAAAQPRLLTMCEAVTAWHPPGLAPLALASSAESCLSALGFTPPEGGWNEYRGP